ncbi:MAG: ABC transporter substrate-binding protein [Clostridia bacterium]|nr:ABC transporter substrate-binding protein [Clostridia bacterium]
MKKRLVILFLIISLCLAGCEAHVGEKDVLGAYGGTDEQKTESFENSDVTLLFYPDMDVNPVTTTCVANSRLLLMVYQPLVRANASFKPECVIAESFSQDGDTLRIVIKDGVKFSDGTPVTAQDALKSISLAKKTETSPYYSTASLISKCYAEGEKTVVIEFERELSDAASLVDIPIMKDGKAGIGSGPYKFSVQNGKQILSVNEHYPIKPAIAQIRLVESKTDDYVATLFSAGELDVLTVPGSDDLALTSLRNYSTLTYPSNNLIYIGINTQNEKFADPAVRRAISSCIDREKISKQTLASLASATVYPYNPDYYKMSIYNVESSPKDVPDPTPLEKTKLTLIVPEESVYKTAIANAMADSFKTLGITLKLDILPQSEYISKVTTGNFELYLGETAVSRTMDPSFLFKTGGSMNYCGYSNEKLDDLFWQFHTSGTGFDKCLAEFSKEMPIIPIVFKKNVMYSSVNLQGFVDQTAWDSYGSFERVVKK